MGSSAPRMFAGHSVLCPYKTCSVGCTATKLSGTARLLREGIKRTNIFSFRSQ
jgi:hypothetical protein